MIASARSKAEERFAKTSQREQDFLKEREKQTQASLEKMSRLRALRLAKEAEDREAVVAQAAAKPARQRSRKAKKPAE